MIGFEPCILWSWCILSAKSSECFNEYFISLPLSFSVWPFLTNLSPSFSLWHVSSSSICLPISLSRPLPSFSVRSNSLSLAPSLSLSPSFLSLPPLFCLPRYLIELLWWLFSFRIPSPEFEWVISSSQTFGYELPWDTLTHSPQSNVIDFDNFITASSCWLCFQLFCCSFYSRPCRQAQY